MRTLNNREKSIIRQLVGAAQDTPVAIHDLLKEFYFKEALGRALILQNQGAYAVFFLEKDAFDDPHKRAEEIRCFFELLALLSYLNRSGHITIYRHETEKMYFLQDGFDAPKVTGNTILLNTRGYYTTAPDTIYNSDKNVMYKGVVFRNDHYNLILNVTAGFLLVSETLYGVIKDKRDKKEEKDKRVEREESAGSVERDEWRKRTAAVCPKRKNPLAVGVLLVLCAFSVLSGYLLFVQAGTCMRRLNILDAAHQTLTDSIQSMAGLNTGNAGQPAHIALSASQEKTYYGIDISRYNGNLASLISASDSLTFVICKATEGVTLIDPQFKSNWERLRANGCLRGAYHFYRTNDNPQAQAAFFWNTISAQGRTDIAPVVDIEQNSFPKSTAFRDIVKIQRDLLRFLDLLETLSHRKPVVYTSRSFADVYLLNRVFSKYPLWLADYSGADTPRLPKTWETAGYKIWQKRSNYTLHAHQSNYDVFYGKLSDLTN
jgi:GH25 family lysozyme M1 (1,4-beta-N-acetylmuramidase)